MEISGTPESTGMTEAQAADAFEAMLTRQEGDSAAEDVAEEETPQSEAEDEPDEGAEAEDESDDAEEDTEAPTETPALVTVKIDGEEKQVTLDEVVKGYQREADYTRKTMALADERKAFMAEVQSFSPERERTKNLLTQLEQALATPSYDQETLDWLRANEPANYAVAIAENLQRADQLRNAQAERYRLQAQQQREQEAATAAALRDEGAKLLAAIPAWKDEKVAEAERKVMIDYATELGFSPDEVSSILDHRMVRVLKDAADYRALKAKVPQVRTKVAAVKTAVPGAKTQTPSKVTDVTRAKQRLAKTGREADAAAVFMQYLPD